LLEPTIVFICIFVPICSPQEHLNNDFVWKFETTQNLQRQFMTDLYNASASLSLYPNSLEPYTKIQGLLESHCQRVFNDTCQWHFSPPFNGTQVDQRASKEREGANRANAVILYICCADEQEFGDLLWSLKFLDLNFNDFFSYPIFIFHDNLSPAQISTVRQSTR